MSLHPVEPCQLTTSWLAYCAAATLLAVMLGGLWQISATLLQSETLDFPRSWHDFKDGRMTNTLEKQLNQKLPARTDLIAVANSVRFLLLRAGGDQVCVGRDGWLFLTEELQYDPQANASLSSRLTLVRNVSITLQNKGIKLLVVVVPDKARIHAPYLPSSKYPDYNANRYQSALSGLTMQGVEVLDLLTPLLAAAQTRAVYYKTDTHWNQTGAQVAARALADRIKQLSIPMEQTLFTLSEDKLPSERAGDLIRLMGLEKVPTGLRPAPDEEAVQRIEAVSNQSEAGGLLGDSAVSVVLVGTSYSLRGNFHGHLQQALSTKVLNAAKDGAGFWQAMGAYLKDEAFTSEPPKVIVWEVPERLLTLPL